MGFIVFWFRRDLRLCDNKGLFEALRTSHQVLPLFIFDEKILDGLPANDHRVEFIHQTLSAIHAVLVKEGSGLHVRKGKPLEVFSNLLEQYDVKNVYCNQDHEPYGRQRDDEIRNLLSSKGIGFHQFMDHLVMGLNDVVKPDGLPYTVFTPYSLRWKKKMSESLLQHYPAESFMERFSKMSPFEFPALASLGFESSGFDMPVANIDQDLIRNYHTTRDFPHLDGTSRLGVFLRFGTISIRSLVKMASLLNETFLNELIWREFYAMILYHFPRVEQESFRVEYDRISWKNNESLFESWKAGKTGFPMVDAGMRQLAATGYMHNRLRMITASFLTKNLLIDWRWGERWFAGKLFDFELSSNNGGWQWCAGTGTDAAPYFRIFNPLEQQKKFDPAKDFVRSWLPEIDSPDYPNPVIDLKQSRLQCLAAYQFALRG
ncbi:MAG TPA: deoxyribodipyrimidine photo-lyase [Bacteroidales bacterium]|nr:deoxyribodipyrimidine photo-lyase [Bacteroidales bacterium]